MNDIKKQIGIRINESIYDVVKDVTEYLRMSSVGELIEIMIEDSLEGTSPFTPEQLDMIREIKTNKGLIDTTVIEDTIIFPAEPYYFNSVFMREYWYPLTIAENRIPYIKYAAAYITMPKSCISHYAQVQFIDQMPGSSKYRIIFKPN